MKRILLIFSAFILFGALAILVTVETYKSQKTKILKPPFHKHASRELTSAELVLFGDSRAAQWSDHFSEIAADTANAGIGGDVTAGMLQRLDKDVIQRHPAWVVVVAGINDLVAGSMLPTENRRQNIVAVIDNLTEIIQQLVAKEANVVVLTITPPLQPDLIRQFVWGENIAADVEQVNRSIRSLTSEKIFVVETMDVFKSAGDNWLEMCILDTLHYTSDAYELLSDEIGSVMRENR